MRRSFETLLVALVGLAIVGALAWLTTEAVQPLFRPAPEPTPTSLPEPTPIVVATAKPRAMPTVVRELSPTARPTRVAAPVAPPSAPTAPAVRRAPTTAPRRRPTEAPRLPAATDRWSAPRDHRVDASAKLHEEPDPDSHVIARLRPGTVVRVVAEREGWMRIESSLGRRGGWIESRLLRPVR